jgi:uncharacterized protein (TIGR03792 family)
MTVIEELTLTMPTDRIAAYLERDAEVWTPYLESCNGFLGKETWLPDDRPDTVVLVIRWASIEQWKSITPEQVEDVDRAMGDLLPTSLECRSYSVVG